MEYIDSKDLELIGQGTTSQVYKYKKPLVPSGLSAVVKMSRLINPSNAVKNYELLRNAGVMHLAFYNECRVDGKPALLMEDLFTDNWVYVSPNSVRNRFEYSLPEAYLLYNKLNDISNMDSLLIQLRDLVNCTNGSGIGLEMDMISFGVQRGNKDSDVSYKLVDIDSMCHNEYSHYQLYESNKLGAIEAISLFVEYFIETDDVKRKLYQQINDFDW